AVQRSRAQQVVDRGPTGYCSAQVRGGVDLLPGGRLRPRPFLATVGSAMGPLNVHVDCRKWGDRLHWQTSGLLLGEDEFGTWLGGAAGTVAYSGPRGTGVFESAFVQLFPRDEWWVAIWNA